MNVSFIKVFVHGKAFWIIMEIADPTTLYKVLYTVATNKCKNIITGRYMFDRYADVHCKKDILLNCKF